MADKSALGEIETLSRIWQRVLDKTNIGVEETFFELGGNPQLTIELFREIQEHTGRLLSPLVIYQAPTITSLALILAAPSNPLFPKSVLLKSGAIENPVFLLHGLGGDIMEFFYFVNSLVTSQAVYGLQARGTDGMEEPFSSIEGMAQYHLDAIRLVQPHGPYRLVGYSLGGLVALEMARNLRETGESIASLVMIDSYPPLVYAPLGQQIRVYSRRARKYFVSKRPRSAARLTSMGVLFTPAMARVEQAAMKALRNYQPRHYSGKIHFVRAANPLNFADDPKGVWGKFTDQFEVQDVPGDHHEMLTIYYEQLAEIVTRYLHGSPEEAVATAGAEHS
jgi:thioesterase domain-containing protein